MAKKTRKRSTQTVRKKARKKRLGKSFFHTLWFRVFLIILLLAIGYGIYLDSKVYNQFEGKRWSLPARVYARPLEIFEGQRLNADRFSAELKAMGYRFTHQVDQAGEVSRSGADFHVMTRPFAFWDGEEPSRNVYINFSGGKIVALDGARDEQAFSLVRFDPLEIGSIHTARQEDRELLRLTDVPALLTDTLIAIEDRSFYQHHGVSIRGIARAALANLKAGGVVQGGSTLTQQLVKNFFLTNKRSYPRKINEALMSILLEIRYDKKDILEAYLNEIYLAQDGQRAIHGFGLGSRYLFQRPPGELTTEQIALLVGMVKGPSFFDPRRHPENARQRRNLVLRVMREHGLIDYVEEERAQAATLGLIEVKKETSQSFPGFIDLVRRQLRRDYVESDLTSEGLKIFTTLDPQVQWGLQKSIANRLNALDVTHPDLQAAAIVTQASNGEVLALAGGRRAGFAGFNRALDAMRPVGSLIKPAVFLTALKFPQQYTLASLISDEPLHVEQKGAPLWSPQNYDQEFHGQITLYQALAKSYNVATARLGLDVGLSRVIKTIEGLGIETHLNPYPSLLLGAVELSPLEITSMYQTFASGGYRTPLRGIRAVMGSSGEQLQRYSLEVHRAIEPDEAVLITRAMQGVVAQGTARHLGQRFSSEFGLAGKTGTTDDMRDSWYAGFDGDKLAVIWVGRDDNQPMGLTGSSGALRIWGDLFEEIAPRPVLMAIPESIRWYPIDTERGAIAGKACLNAVQLPFLSNSTLPEINSCTGSGDMSNWYEDSE
ncbi:MAG: penicillin-binding protein 1B [Gammaproteobacteria bacterium]